MKKVLFTATVDSHILQFHLPFLKLFKENGYEVHVATNSEDDIPYCDKKHKVSFERSPFNLKNIKAFKQLKKICDIEKFDIIHTHTPMGSVVTRLSAIKSRKSNHTRVLYTAHGFHFYSGAPLINWILYYPVEKFLSRYTDTLVLINKEDYNIAKTKFKKCKDVCYVPGVGIDTKRFNIKMSIDDIKKYKKSIGLSEEDFVLTCVARIDKNKNQIFLINVMEELKKEFDNIKLLIVGPDEINGFCQKAVKEKKLENYVSFLGYRDDIPELMLLSDIIVSASLREGLPVNIIEALTCSKPVVALNCRGMDELIDNNRNGFLVNHKTNNTINDFVSAIKKIYKMDNNTLRIIKNNNEKKAKNYQIDTILDYYKKIYFKK